MLEESDTGRDGFLDDVCGRVEAKFREIGLRLLHVNLVEIFDSASLSTQS